uniref:Uncharacterized protein n=1 Tax=Glossina pallidipes TaxID=7398 RepID=A0A1A9ZXS4_GLOPL
MDKGKRVDKSDPTEAAPATEVKSAGTSKVKNQKSSDSETDKGTDNFPKIEQKKRTSAPEGNISNFLKNNKQSQKQSSFKDDEVEDNAANDSEERRDGSAVNNGKEKEEEIEENEVARAALLGDNKNKIDIRDETGKKNGKDFSSDNNDNQDGHSEQNHAKRSTYDEKNGEQIEKHSSFKEDELEHNAANDSEQRKGGSTLINGKEKMGEIEEIEVARATLLDDNKNKMDVSDETAKENGKDLSTDNNDSQDGNGEQHHAKKSTYDEENDEQSEKQSSFKEDEIEDTAANDSQERKDSSTLNNDKEKKEEIAVARATLLDDNNNKTGLRDETGKESGKDFFTDNNGNQGDNDEQNRAKRSTYEEGSSEQREEQTSFKEEETEANDSEERKDSSTVNNVQKEKADIEVLRANSLEENDTNLTDATESKKELFTRATRKTQTDEYLINHGGIDQHRSASIEETILKTNGTEKQAEEYEDIEAATLEVSTKDDKKEAEEVKDIGPALLGAYDATENRDALAISSDEEGKRRTADAVILDQAVSKKQSVNKDQNELTREDGKKTEGEIFDDLRSNVGKDSTKTKDAVTSTIEEGECPPLYLMQNTLKEKKRVKGTKRAVKSLIEKEDEEQNTSLKRQTIGAIENQNTSKGDRKIEETSKSKDGQKERRESRDAETTPSEDKVNVFVDNTDKGKTRESGTKPIHVETERNQSLIEKEDEEQNTSLKRQTIGAIEKQNTSERDRKIEETSKSKDGQKERRESRDAETTPSEDKVNVFVDNTDKGKTRESGTKPIHVETERNQSLIEKEDEEQNTSLKRQTIGAIENQNTSKRDRKIEETSKSKDGQKERRESRDAETTPSEDKVNVFVDNTDKGETRYSGTKPIHVETERNQSIYSKQSNGKEQTKKAETVLMKDKETQSGDLEHHKLLVSNNYKAIDKSSENVTTQTDYHTTEYGSKEMLIETKTYPPPALFYHAPQQRREDHPIPGTSQEMATFCHSFQCRREQPRFSQPAEMIQGHEVGNNCSTYFMRVCNRDTSTDRMRRERIYDATRTQDELHREDLWDPDNEPHSSNRMPRMHYSRERPRRSPQKMEIRKRLDEDEMRAETSGNKHQYNQEYGYSATNKQNDALKKKIEATDLDGRPRDVYKEYEYSPHSTMDNMNVMERGVYRLCRHENGGTRCDECHTYKYIPQNVKNEIPPGSRRYVSPKQEEEKGYENNFENLKRAKNPCDENHHPQYFAHPIKERSSYSLGCRSVCAKNGQQTCCSTQCIECVEQNSAHRQYARKNINERNRGYSCESLNREFDSCQRNRSNTSSEYNRDPYERQEGTFEQRSCEGVEETVTRPSVAKCLMEYLEGKLRCNFINRLKQYDVFNYIYQNSQNMQNIEVREDNATNLENNSPSSEHNRETSPTTCAQISRHNGRVNISNVSINKVDSSESQQSIKNIKIELEIHTPKTIHKRDKAEGNEVNASDLEDSQEKALAIVTAFNEENLRRNSSTHQSEKILCPPVNIRHDSNSEHEASYFMYTSVATSSLQTPRRKHIVAAYVKEQRIDNSVASSSEEKLRDQCGGALPARPPLPSSRHWICDENVEADTAEKETKPLKKYSFKRLPSIHVKALKEKIRNILPGRRKN